MFKKIYKYFLTGLIFLFFITIFIILTNSDLRRNIFNYPASFLNFYYETRIKFAVNEKNFKKASYYLVQYIDISQKFSKGKNMMLVSIMKKLTYASSKALSQDDFNNLENVYEKINEIDDKIYLNNVWLGRALMDNNPELSQIYLIKAINLAPASEEAFRQILNIYKFVGTNQKIDPFLIQQFCEKFSTNIDGGTYDLISFSFFDGNIKDFGIFLNYEEKNIYRQKISEFNKFAEYQFNFLKQSEVNAINLIGTFSKGSIIEIKDIYFNGDKKNKINFNETYFVSKHNYVLKESEDKLEVLNPTDDNNIITLLTKKYENIESITLSMKLNKIPLTNKNFCKSVYEN